MTKSEEWGQFSAYRPMIEDAKRTERDRIIALLEANVGHNMDRYRYWSEVFELIKGENSE